MPLNKLISKSTLTTGALLKDLLFIASICMACLFLPLTVYGQSKVSGTVVDTSDVPVVYANVCLINCQSGTMEDFTFTNTNGKFEIPLSEPGKYELTVSALSFKIKSDTLVHKDGIKHATLRIILHKKQFELEEVQIKASLPIQIKKDTIIFDAEIFSKGTEQVVEDLIKNLPGIQVDNKGNIRAGNKEVEKVMIEGDDFFEKGYKILTKNMPVDPIEKVELLQNYSENHLLRGIEESEKVALNLKLKEDAKRHWFGNTKIGYGQGEEKRHELLGNLMNFGKRDKYYFMSNLNNTGYDATGEIEQLTHSANEANIGKGESAQALIDLSFDTPGFNTDRTNFNKNRLLSLNTILRPSSKVQIKLLAFLNGDKNTFAQNTLEQYRVDDLEFSVQEQYNMHTKSNTGVGIAELNYEISKKSKIESETKLSFMAGETSSNLNFNDTPLNEGLSSDNIRFDHRLTYTQKLSEHKVLLINARHIIETKPQDYTVNRILDSLLFPTSDNANNLEQNIENKMQFSGIEAHLLHKKQKSSLFEVKLGYKFRKDELQSALKPFGNDTELLQADNFQNRTSFSTSDIYCKLKYLIIKKHFRPWIALEIHQLFNKHRYQTKEFIQNPLTLNPILGSKFEMGTNSSLTVKYKYSSFLSKVDDVYANYILTDYRTFLKGSEVPGILNTSYYTINYQYGDWGDRFFIDAIALYSKDHSSYSIRTDLSPDYSFSDKLFTENKGQDIYTTTINTDYFIKQFSTNIKLKLGYSSLNFYNKVNDEQWRRINTSSYTYGIQLRSALKRSFNFHFGTEWFVNGIKLEKRTSNTTNLSFLDISYFTNKKTSIKIKAERYNFRDVLSVKANYYFIDLTAKYELRKNKATLFLQGTNLLNTKSFKKLTFFDTHYTISEYKLLPGYLLLSIEFRF